MIEGEAVVNYVVMTQAERMESGGNDAIVPDKNDEHKSSH